MANQIIVTDSGNVQVSITPTNNVQVEISRAAITTLTSVGNANYANVAGTVANSSQPNITSLGTLVNLTSAGNITAPFFIGNVIGNVSGNIVVPGTNTSVLYNNAGVAGASDAFQFNQSSNTVTITGNLSATNISGNGAGLSAITGANVSGQVGYAAVANSVSGSNVSGAVAYATTANSVAGANVSGQVSYAATANSVAGANVSGAVAYATTANAVAGSNVSGQVSYAAVANSVAVANVSGIGNISTINIDGNLGNVLYGNGVFAAVIAPTSVANANYANFAGTAFSVSGSNVSGTVANATYADNAGNATIANSANSVAVANVSGIGNIATVNLDGNSSNILYGNGVFATTPIISNVANANYANFAGTAYSVSGANVSGEVANANYSTYSGQANTANLATYATTANSVAVANVSGIGNIATTNYDGNAGNVLYGNGGFYALPTISNVANANFANYAGNVTVNSQPNITSVGTLISLDVTGNVSANAYQLTTSPGTLTPATGQMVWDTAGNTVSLGMLNGVTQQIGLESYVLVKASATITDGQVVMFTGANGNHIQAAPADTTSVGFRPEYIIGVATQNIATNDFGYITVFGIVHGLNTNSFNVGDILWVDNSTPGALTATRPTDPNFQIEVAAVTKKSSSDGHLQVRVTPFNNIDNLTDVTITTPSAGQALVYNASNLWVNGVPAYANTANSVAVANVSGIGNIATINLTGSSSNVLYGNGVFAPESTSIANANYANFAGQVVDATQANITSLGNLTSLTIANVVTNPRMVINPAGNTIGLTTQSNSFVSITNYGNVDGNLANVQSISFIKARGNSTTQTAAANNDVIMSLNSYVYNGNTYPKSVQIRTTAPLAANSTFANSSVTWTPGSFQVITGNPNGNVTSTTALNNQNQLSYTQNGTLVLATGRNGNGTGVPILNMINYGVAANGVGGTTPALFQRARGDRDANTAVGNTDQIGSLGFQAYNGNAFFSTRFASISANVNTNHGAIANGASVPTDLVFTTCSNTTGYSTTFYGNATATFPGSIQVSPSNAPNLSLGQATIPLLITSYGEDTGNLQQAAGIGQFRARGNSASVASVQPNDQIGQFLFIPYNGTAYTGAKSGAVRAVVDSTYTTGNTIVPIKIDIRTIDSANTTITSSFEANGQLTLATSLVVSNGTSNLANLQLNRFQETVYAIGSTSGTITPDFNNGSIQTMTLTGSITMNTLANAIAGRSMTLIVTQGGSGSYTLTSSMLYAGGSKILSTTVGAVDIISVFYDGSTYYASLTKGYV